VVTPIAAGSATIKATSNSDSTKFGSCVATVTLGGALSITLNSLGQDGYYYWSPAIILFSGTVTCEQGSIASIDIYLSDKITKVISNISVSGNIWREWITVNSGIRILVAKVTTIDGRVAWSNERTLIVSPNYIFAFTSSNNLYRSPDGLTATFSFYESMPSNSSYVVVYKNIIYDYKSNGKISYRNVDGGVWAEDSAVLLNVKSYNIYKDNMAYAYTYDGKLYKKSILVANSAWTLIDNIANTEFATVGCDNFTAYGIKNTGELWTKDLTTTGSVWTFNSYISYNGSRITGATAITVLENVIIIFDQNTKKIYSTFKGSSTWDRFSTDIDSMISLSFN
jgi:hypothetical protein